MVKKNKHEEAAALDPEIERPNVQQQQPHQQEYIFTINLHLPDEQ
jgi:hypothetical protein